MTRFREDHSFQQGPLTDPMPETIQELKPFMSRLFTGEKSRQTLAELFPGEDTSEIDNSHARRILRAWPQYAWEKSEGLFGAEDLIISIINEASPNGRRVADDSGHNTVAAEDREKLTKRVTLRGLAEAIGLVESERTTPRPVERSSSAARTSEIPAARVQRELEDLQSVLKARNGNADAMDALLRRYTGFVRLKASSYFLAGGDHDDLLQEGMIGLYKAVRDFNPDKDVHFRTFAELCITRQIITAIKTATRFKHTPLNTYISFSHVPEGADEDVTLGDALPGPAVHEPSLVVISTEELQSLVFVLGTGLTELESEALRLYLEGESYEDMASALNCDTKSVDNALQRVKRKIIQHQKAREVLL